MDGNEVGKSLVEGEFYNDFVQPTRAYLSAGSYSDFITFSMLKPFLQYIGAVIQGTNLDWLVLSGAEQRIKLIPEDRRICPSKECNSRSSVKSSIQRCTCISPISLPPIPPAELNIVISMNCSDN
jgi:hypothetical protein